LIIAILLLAVLITGLVSFQVISTYNDQNNRAFLLSAGALVMQRLAAGESISQAASDTLTVFNQRDQKLRITLVNRQGVVLYDNEADSSQMDNHLFRAEVAYTFKTQTVGVAIRRSGTLDTEMIYVAQYDAAGDQVIRTAMPVYHSRTGLYEMIMTLVIVLATALVVLSIIASLAARWIVRPLQELQQAAQDMADGHYDVRIHRLHQGDNEIAVLSESFNAMAGQLETTVRSLEERNARLDVIFNTMAEPMLAVTDNCAVTFMNQRARDVFGRDLDPAKAVYPLLLITHSVETEKLVARALAECKPVRSELSLETVQGKGTYLVIASPVLAHTTDGVILTFHDMTEPHRLQRMRSEFVANVTHELRTPLTSIRGFIETLREGAIQKPEVADRFLEIIDIEAERLHKLISDILALSEIEDLKSEKNLETFDLNAQLDDVAVLLDDTAHEAKVSLVVLDNDQPLLVQANRSRIKQVLINLADNAIKYNRPGGKVYVSAGRNPDGLVCIKVRDTGVGIAREHQDRIFERFYRVDKSRSRELGGTGLGLSIVKHIAQLYGGYATVESSEGEGATFTVCLKI
jgi:two-component system phosphate regulon sensor histidine kinase PhoR